MLWYQRTSRPDIPVSHLYQPHMWKKLFIQRLVDEIFVKIVNFKISARSNLITSIMEGFSRVSLCSSEEVLKGRNLRRICLFEKVRLVSSFLYKFIFKSSSVQQFAGVLGISMKISLMTFCFCKFRDLMLQLILLSQG